MDISQSGFSESSYPRATLSRLHQDFIIKMKICTPISALLAKMYRSNFITRFIYSTRLFAVKLLAYYTLYTSEKETKEKRNDSKRNSRGTKRY